MDRVGVEYWGAFDWLKGGDHKEGNFHIAAYFQKGSKEKGKRGIPD
jgi:hypothetical protein